MTMFLTERLNPSQAMLTERRVGQDLFLSGIMMQSELKNGNGRVYPLAEITEAVNYMKKSLEQGHYICGELQHPDTLTINLANVSHCITEARMDGNNAVGKMKLLNTPSGNICRGLIEGGVRLGVSSRGTGDVNESGQVSSFLFKTMDIVHEPSAPNAYPDPIMEAMGNKKVMTLAEALVHDPKAQAHLAKEMSAFIASIFKGVK